MITLWELGHHQRRCNCGGKIVWNIQYVSNVLLQWSTWHLRTLRRADWRTLCFPLSSSYWLLWKQSLKGKVRNVPKWVMFVLWLSGYICNRFSSSIQLVMSPPCNTWHRELLYRQLQATCFRLVPDLKDVSWRDQQVLLHVDAVFSGAFKSTRKT